MLIQKISSAACLQQKAADAPPNPVVQILRSFFRRFDLMQVIPLLTLLAIGALFIYGTGQQVGGVHAVVFWKRQLAYMGIGIVIWFCLTMFDYRWLGPASLGIYPVSVFLLVYVLVAGVEMFGAKRWIDFGGVSLQPSELAKLAIILGVSWVLSFRKADINKPLWALLVLGIAGIPMALILKEPDLGTSLVIVPIVGGIAFVARLKWRYMLILFVMFTAFMPIAYYMLHDYQKERIKTFLDPDRDPQNRGYNQYQAMIAVGSGSVTGKGFMKGTHCTLGYLPKTVANSDFIFPVIAEETGFIGTFSLLLLYAFLLFSIFRTALYAPDAFGRFLCVGIGAVFIMHTSVNIGMCIQLAPVTGLPLPLVSYGGTFMVATLTYLGIVQSVYAHRGTESFLSL